MSVTHLHPWVEPWVREYIQTSDIGEKESLRVWGSVRRLYPLLCGDMPPLRWVVPVAHWCQYIHVADESFEAVSFRTPLSLTEATYKGEKWLQLYYKSNHAHFVTASFNAIVDSLMEDAVITVFGALSNDEPDRNAPSPIRYFG